MKLAYIVFDNITWLDFIGVYDPISRLKSMQFINNLSWDVCSVTDTVKDHFGLEMMPAKKGNDLSVYDAVIIPGGYGTRELVADNEFLSWIKTAEPVRYKISICTGSLILGAAGFLKGKTATSHFAEYETLQAYCKEVKKERIVADGDVITAGAVTSSIDLGLFLCEKWVGKEAATQIRETHGLSRVKQI